MALLAEHHLIVRRLDAVAEGWKPASSVAGRPGVISSPWPPPRPGCRSSPVAGPGTGPVRSAANLHRTFSRNRIVRLVRST